MTNADKIRQMTDEELLEWVVDKVDFVCMAYGTERCRKCESCRSCWKDWLAEFREIEFAKREVSHE